MRARRRRTTARRCRRRCRPTWRARYANPSASSVRSCRGTFRSLLASWKVAPALAAGCTVILKPSSATPLTALELGKIAHRSGFARRRAQRGDGFDAIRSARGWSSIPEVDKISFTGSTATGKSVAAAAAQTLKRVTLELGGKSPAVVFDDADIEGAVAGALYGVYYNAGQCCEARSRILVQDGVYDGS